MTQVLSNAIWAGVVFFLGASFLAACKMALTIASQALAVWDRRHVHLERLEELDKRVTAAAESARKLAADVTRHDVSLQEQGRLLGRLAR